MISTSSIPITLDNDEQSPTSFLIASSIEPSLTFPETFPETFYPLEPLLIMTDTEDTITIEPVIQTQSRESSDKDENDNRLT